MYFIINKDGVHEYKGTVCIRYDCFLDVEDDGYDVHHVFVPDAKEPYQGKVNEFGFPVDIKDYNIWIQSLPKIERDNPFCCHFRCFEPDVTEDELISAGKEILSMAFENNKVDRLKDNTNPTIEFSSSIVKIQASLSKVSEIKQVDFVAVSADTKEEK